MFLQKNIKENEFESSQSVIDSIFTIIEISTQKRDSILGVIKKKYYNYKDVYIIRPIVKVDKDKLIKRINEINEVVLFYKKLGKLPIRPNVKSDTLLDLSILVGGNLKIVIDTSYTFVGNGYSFSGHVEKCKGTTYAGFILFNTGAFSGQIIGFEYKITNFEQFEDSLLVGISFPFNNPGEKYIQK